MQQTPFAPGKQAAPAAPRQLDSLHRALDVLERLAQHRGEISLSDLARGLSMSKAGVYRILTTMSARGYVDKRPRGAYRLGVRAWELGCAVPELRLVTVAAPFMERLTSTTRESSILGMLVGFHVVYLHRIDAFQAAVRVHTDIGTRIPAHATSTGLALLSRLDAGQLEALLPPALEPFTPDTITDPDRLRGEVARTARRGYALTVGTWRAEVAGVAAAILDAEGAPIAAINVSLPRVRSTRRRLAELGETISATAQDISRALRFSGFTREQLPPDGRAGLGAAPGPTTARRPR
jgi:IclR family acetate operon transcriptional repressor